MKVMLTDNPSDLGGRSVSAQPDCACDCQCACPTDGVSFGEPVPVLLLPAAYYLELTPACNNRCPGCGNADTFFDQLAPGGRRPARASTPPVVGTWGFSRGPLDGQGWCDLIARLASHARQFKLTGGEPTLHPELAAIVRQIDRLGIPFTLFSNGRWANSEALLQTLHDLESFDGFLISLHGPDAVTHEAFNGVPGSFDETVSNIRRAVESGFDVAVSMVITSHSWDRVAGMRDLVVRLGANHLVCNRLIGPLTDLTPGEAQLRAAIAEVESGRAQGQAVRFGNCIPQCFEPSSSRGCTAGVTFGTIDPWGRMRPCNHSPLIAGDVQTQPVQAVWHSAVMDGWRSLVPAECRACTEFTTCHGGCRAQGLLVGERQDPLVADPFTAERLSPVSVLDEPALRLFERLCPEGAFAHHSDAGLALLLYKSTVVPVPSNCAQLAFKLDGSLTLRQIERQYGDSAVDWVGLLYQEGLVTWASA